MMGHWPRLIKKPAFAILDSVRQEGYTRYHIEYSWRREEKAKGYLLVPDEQGVKPAVVTVFYEPETAVGLKDPITKPYRDLGVQLAKRGFVVFSTGISGASLNLDLATAMKLTPTQRGVLVATVTPNSPASKAGLQPSNSTATINGQDVPVGGDVITAINGQPTNTIEDLIAYLAANTEVGQKVEMTILRNGKQVGYLTSGGYGYTVGRAIGYGYIPDGPGGDRGGDPGDDQ